MSPSPSLDILLTPLVGERLAHCLSVARLDLQAYLAVGEPSQAAEGDYFWPLHRRLSLRLLSKVFGGILAEDRILHLNISNDWGSVPDSILAWPHRLSKLRSLSLSMSEADTRRILAAPATLGRPSALRRLRVRLSASHWRQARPCLCGASFPRLANLSLHGPLAAVSDLRHWLLGSLPSPQLLSHLCLPNPATNSDSQDPPSWEFLDLLTGLRFLGFNGIEGQGSPILGGQNLSSAVAARLDSAAVAGDSEIFPVVRLPNLRRLAIAPKLSKLQSQAISNLTTKDGQPLFNAGLGRLRLDLTIPVRRFKVPPIIWSFSRLSCLWLRLYREEGCPVNSLPGLARLLNRLPHLRQLRLSFSPGRWDFGLETEPLELSEPPLQLLLIELNSAVLALALYGRTARSIGQIRWSQWMEGQDQGRLSQLCIGQRNLVLPTRPDILSYRHHFSISL